MRIKTGDEVIVISGKDKGKKGKVLKTFPREERIIVENINMITKHNKPMGPTNPGGIVKTEGPIHVSKVMYYSDSAKKGSRVRYEIENGRKVRVCVETGKKIDK